MAKSTKLPSRRSSGAGSLVTDLRTATSDPELTDVTLLGTDGVSVSASRFILAARSRVFRSMLFGRFSESTSPVVKVSYTSDVLRALVEYCLSDEMPRFEYLSGEEEARAMVGLVNASHFFDLTDVENKAYRCACGMMEDRPPLACVVLEEASRAGETNAANLRRRAREIIMFRSREALLPIHRADGPGVMSLGSDVLREVVMDEKIHADEITMFRCIKKWAEASEDGVSLPAVDETMAGGKRKHNSTDTIGDNDKVDRRLATAKELTAHIKLSRIPPSDLRNLVAKSGLVEPDRIAAAFEAQALRAERRGFAFSEPRCTAPPGGSVVVRGAGVPEVNGPYVPCGTCDDVPKYSRNGLKDNRLEKIFTLFRFPSNDGTRRWYISIVPTNFPPGTDDDHDYYYLPSDYDTPFGRAWVTKEEGVDPAPICIWEPDDNSDSDF